MSGGGFIGYKNDNCGSRLNTGQGTPCKMATLGNLGGSCGIGPNDREEDALAKVNNRIFFMGITKYGYQKPIRESVNPAYRDKFTGRPQLEQFLPDPNATDVDYGRLAENFRNIDVYSGLVDGKNYGRFNRLYHQKHRHARNPNGLCVTYLGTENHRMQIYY